MLKPEQPQEAQGPTGKNRPPRPDPRAAVPDATTAGAIPWGYGLDRVGAMAVDPDRLFVYWEVTDESIERVRDQAGDTEDRGALVLRVYDVTGRIFDGSNAHGHFEHEVERGDRQWFFDINKPASETVVDLGLRFGAGGFSRLARSSRVEFPRAQQPPASPPRWLTVRVRGGRSELTPEPPRPPREHGRSTPDPAPSPGEGTRARGEDSLPHVEPTGSPTDSGERHPAGPPPIADTAHTEPAGPREEGPLPVELRSEETRSFHWEKPASWNSWERGPFSTELEAIRPWTESHTGESRIYRDGSGTHVVTGPWEVVIRGLGAYRRHAVLAQWEMQHSWIQEEGEEIRREARGDGRGVPGAGSSALLGAGASERRWQAGSELRLSGSSELLYLGASERRLGGASERRWRGASERRLGGASERGWRGASQHRLGGASERLLREKSERSQAGAAGRAPRGTGEGRLDGDYPRIKGKSGT